MHRERRTHSLPIQAAAEDGGVGEAAAVQPAARRRARRDLRAARPYNKSCINRSDS
jgi:hypothetical protein